MKGARRFMVSGKRRKTKKLKNSGRTEIHKLNPSPPLPLTDVKFPVNPAGTGPMFIVR